MTEEELLNLVEGLNRSELRVCVENGWVRPSRGGSRYEFSAIDIARVQLIHEMRHDLRVEDETIPVMLSLIDQIYGLRRQLRELISAVQAQPESVQRNIVEDVRH